MATTLNQGRCPMLSDLLTSRPIRAFIFDVDGVVADTAGFHVAAWKGAVQEQGIDFPESIAESLRGESRRRSLELILGERTISQEQFETIMHRKNEAYVAALSRLTNDDCMPGVVRLIGLLRKNGIKVGAVSASQSARRVLQLIGASKLFETVVDGRDAQFIPEKHRFEIAVAKLEVSPANCCVVEDSLANIVVAKKLGMCAIGVGPAASSNEADYVLETLEALVRRENALPSIRLKADDVSNEWNSDCPPLGCR
ncbi:MAG: HAD-IA family hydrolase [Planctomycetes bacterium]|nr:HAD-IA family hydrolase [Planctomycetota bacterium]